MTMVALTNPTLTQAPLWYLTRSTGITAFVLLTLAMAFGVAATQRTLASRSWPRFATQNLHRNVSLLGLLFLTVHVVTTLADSFVTISSWNSVLPFYSTYQRSRLWLGLGTVASDLIVVVIVTSLLRLRFTARTWRWIHLSTYALWPMTFLHFLNTGTDAEHGKFGLWIAIMSAGVVGAAVAVRLTSGEDAPRALKSLAR